MSVKPIPDGYHTVTPYILVGGATAAMEFYKQAFGASVKMCMPGPDGKVGHAEMQFGDSTIMLADEMPEMGMKGPKTLGGTPAFLMLYIENVDSQFAQAIAAGAKVIRPLQNQFYGDRSGTVEDPYGHMWTLSTHIEDVEPAEMEKRMEEYKKQHGLAACSG